MLKAEDFLTLMSLDGYQSNCPNKLVKADDMGGAVTGNLYKGVLKESPHAGWVPQSFDNAFYPRGELIQAPLTA